MFLQNLLKKLAEIFSPDSLKNLIINSFREVLIIFVSFCLIISIIVISVVYSKIRKANKNYNYIENNTEIGDDEKSLKPEEIDQFLIDANDLIIPDIETFDVTSDYEEFLPGKKFKAPDKSFIENDYKKILDDTVEDSFKFNFEKRSTGDNNE